MGRTAGQPVIGQFVDQTESEEPIASYDTVHMVAGQRYNIRLEYYQNEGAAMVELGWGGAIAEQIIPTSALFSGSRVAAAAATRRPRRRQ